MSIIKFFLIIKYLFLQQLGKYIWQREDQSLGATIL